MRKPEHIILYTIILLSTFITNSCSHGKSDEDKVMEQADSFANYYYNWRLTDARRFTTPESTRRLAFLASNIDTTDIQQLRFAEYGTEIEVSDVNIETDTTASVSVKIHNYLALDTIGKKLSPVDKIKTELSLRNRGGVWLVNL